ncbi:MAG: TetR/AcrR family transcriptional regulator [Proteobacteria bacterium]|nr:TetR/AcrR family transcriptional regulator [Pseudomonadota bacterium]
MRSRDAALNSDRREAILRAAGSCFVRDGFSATSMKTICADAEMSPGTLYHYFSSKAEIVAAIIARESARTTELFDVLESADDVFASLFDVIDIIALGITDAELVLHAEIAAVVLRDPILREQARMADEAAIMGLAGRFARAQAEGQIDGRLKPIAVATLVSAQIDGLIWRASLHNRTALVELLPALKQAVARILTHPDDAI